MGESEGIPSKFLSLSSSSEDRESMNDGGDEEFYEKIEAPKFVDFSLPNHYSPDDHYWFCLRVGCDQKHEEEMDSEAIYNNFVLRVMAARSPNVRLRKALDRNASRSPTKCPLSAPPKSSKPRLTRMAVVSSFSKKKDEDKKKVVRPLLKPGSTPVMKTKPVAAKYLTTPRNKKCTAEPTSFRSVQHPKPNNVEVPKSRVVAKALVFRSPKKAIKVKTSVELRTPVSKLCQGMNRLEISSQRKRVLGYSSSSSKNLSATSSRGQNLQAKPVKPLHTCKGKEAKSGRLIRTKIKGPVSDETRSLKKKESCDIKKQLAAEVTEESGLQDSSRKEGQRCSVLTSQDDSERGASCLDIEGRDESRSEAIKSEENEGNANITSESLATPVDQSSNGNNATEGEQHGVDFDEGDDKENAAISDENRLPNNTLKQNGRKIFGVHEKRDQVKKKVTQAQDNLKEDSCGHVTKLKKPKVTNPKPFRLRTDERGILKEAVVDRRVEPPSENGNVSSPGGKLQRKNVSVIQKGSSATLVLKTPKKQERSKPGAVAASTTPESNSKHQERKVTSNAMQRLEKFRKLKSPLPKHSARPQVLVASRKQEVVSYLIPGKKLDVIHETHSPEVSEPRSIGKKPTGRSLITVGVEPKFHSTHTPKSCTKKL